MADKDILSELKQSILDFDEDAALELAQESLAQGIDPVEAVGVLADGLNELGVKFERMEVFLPEIMLASDAFKNALSVLEPEIKKKNTEGKKAIPIVIGTVQGDIRITGSAVILPCEEVRNDTRDTFVLSGKSRSVIRGIGRETLQPLQKEVSPMKTKTPKKRGVER